MSQKEVYTASAVSVGSVTTSATGATFVALADLPCYGVEFRNDTGTTLEYKRNGTGTAFPIVTGTTKWIQGITNASQLTFRRTDTSNTQVTAVFEIFAP